MKKFLPLTLSVAAIIGAVSLGTYNTKSSANDSNRYLSVSVTGQNDQKGMLFGSVQPYSEITGQGGKQYRVAYGYNSTNRFDDSKMGLKIGAAYMGVPENKEHALAGEFEISAFPNNSLHISPYFAGQAGIGYQAKNGDTFNTSTSTNKASYSSNQPYSYTPDVGTFQSSPVFVLVGFQLGTKFVINKNFDLYTAYDYQQKTYNVDYTLATSPTVHNNMTYTQKFNGLRAGLNYNF